MKRFFFRTLFFRTLIVASLASFFHAHAQTTADVSASTDQAAATSPSDTAASDTLAANDYAENYAFDDAHDRKTFLALTEVLRCPMCQNQNIADSDAMIAHDMRRKVYQLMQQGQSEQQVIDFMKERYGDFVYYQPPVNSVTIWLWLTPVIFAGIMLLVFIYRKKKPQTGDLQAKLARANQLLKEDE